MVTRVTHRSIQEATLARLQGNLQAIGKLQDQISSGKRITAPSDDPTGTVDSLAIRQQVRLNEQYDRNAQDGLSWLATQDTALQTTSSQLRAARTLVVQALNAGGQTGGSRAAIAVEIDGIAKTVQSLANAQYLGRNVFAGTSGAGSAVQAGTPTTGTGYQGPVFTWAPTGGATVDRQVDGQTPVPVDTNGADVFGTDEAANGVTVNQSVFSLLAQISAEIKSPGSTMTPASTTDTNLSDLLAKLDTRIGKVLEGLASVGARTNRIEQAQSVAADTKVQLAGQLQSVEDTDVPAAIITLQLQSTAYQAALTASSKVLNTSLMDFLR